MSAIDPGQPLGSTLQDARAYIPRRATEDALAALASYLRVGATRVILRGPSGIGVSMLLAVVEARLAKRLRIVRLREPMPAAEQLAARVLEQLGEPESGTPELLLVSLARELRERSSGLTILVDDADSMPLPTVRRLSRLVGEARPAISLVLALGDGAPAESVLAALDPPVESISLREPMTLEETRVLVAARLAGLPECERDPFEDDAIEAIHRESMGVPGAVVRCVRARINARTAAGTAALDAREHSPLGGEEAPETAADVASVEVPSETPIETPVETKMETASLMPAETPEEAANLASVETAVEMPAETASLTPVETALEAESETPVEVGYESPPLAGPSLEDVKREPLDPADMARVPRRYWGVAAVFAATAALLVLLLLRGHEPAPDLPGTEAHESPRVTSPPSVADVAADPDRAVTSEGRAGEAAQVLEQDPEPVVVREATAGAKPPAAAAPILAASRPAMVRVAINAVPWARVEVDGRDAGVTPLADIRLSAGPHRFRATLPDGHVVLREETISRFNRRVLFRDERQEGDGSGAQQRPQADEDESQAGDPGEHALAEVLGEEGSGQDGQRGGDDQGR